MTKRTNRSVAIVGYGLIAGAVAALFMYVRAAEAGDLLSPGMGYYEECIREGCSNEEVREIYSWGNYKEECTGEGCTNEEQGELVNPTANAPAGSGWFGGQPYHPSMLDRFCWQGYTVLEPNDPFCSVYYCFTSKTNRHLCN